VAWKGGNGVSTKRIREVLQNLKAFADEREEDEQLADALDELEAIERAAKSLATEEVNYSLRHAPDDVRAAYRLMESIAKDAQ
jgi:thioredoxin-like negative regulator of GroEL